jgi:hypothetical protein
MSATRGTIETNSNVFNNTVSRDFILRTMDVSEKLVIGNTMCNIDNAGLYITRNSIGIRQVPNSQNILDAPGFRIDAAGCNVFVSNLLDTSAISVGGDVIPKVDTLYDLGSSNRRFRELFLSGSALYLGNTSISRLSNGDLTFIDRDSNLRRLVCSSIDVAGAVINRDTNGRVLIGGTPIEALQYISYNTSNNFTGFGYSNPLGSLHVHNSTAATEMRMILSDQRTGVLTTNVGFQVWKDALSHGYITNYFPGANINIGVSGTGNINLGNATDLIANLNGTAAVNIATYNSAIANLTTYNASNISGITLDASASAGANTPSVGTGGRRFYIRTGGTMASTGEASGDRAGFLEIGDGGGTHVDATARSNLVVLDRYGRMWIGRNIIPNRFGMGTLGNNNSNESLPSLMIMGDVTGTGYKPPVIHLGRNARSNDPTGFSMTMFLNDGSNNLVLGRNNIATNNGYGNVSYDVVVNYLGNVSIGSNVAANTTDKFRVIGNDGASSNLNVLALYNSNSWITVQSKSESNTFNPMVLKEDARIIFSCNNTVDSGSLVIGPWTSATRRGLRLTATGTHEIAGDVFLNGRIGVGVSNIGVGVDLDVAGGLRVSSNAAFSNMTACNLNVVGVSAVGGGTLNIGGDSNTSIVNIACATNSQIVNIGAPGASNTVINIGGPGDTVNIMGTTNTVNMTNTTSCNKTIDLNFGGAAGTGADAGINIMEGGSVAGYMRISGDRTAWLLKAPASPEARIDVSSGSITMGALNMNTNSNVGIGNNNPLVKLDVTGAINATSYCNLQWSFIQNVPSLSAFSNNLSNFPVLNTSNLNASNAVVVGTATLSNVIVTGDFNVANITACNATLRNVVTSTIISDNSGQILLGCESNTQRIDIGTNSNTSLLNIGTIDNGATINIGGSNDIIRIPGTLLATLSVYEPQSDGTFTYVDYVFGNDPNVRSDEDTLVMTSLTIGNGLSPLGPQSVISDKFRIGVFNDPAKITTLNRDSIENSAGNCGIEIEENGVITGWLKTMVTRNGWTIKAPGSIQSLEMSMGDNFVGFQNNTILMVGGSNGVVGIGTANPNTSYKLQVGGSLYANSYVNLPQADVFGTAGIVSLCNAINSVSQTTAATSFAVKTAFDAAVSACNVATGRWIRVNATDVVSGTVSLCDAIDSNLNINNAFAATPKAVMDTWNFAATKWSSNQASAATQGIVFITDSTTCNISSTVQPIAASARGLSLVNTLALSKWTASFATNTAPGYVFVSDATNCNRGWSATDAFFQGPIVASVKSVFDTMQLAITASNRAHTTIPATNFVMGSVLLSDATNQSNLNTTSSIAATPAAVASAFLVASWTSNFSASRWSNVNASSVVQGTVLLSDSINSTSGQSTSPPLAATPLAVKTVNDALIATSNTAFTAWQPVNASTTVRGFVHITDVTDCNAGTANSVPVVPTALALSNVRAVAVSASNRAFGTQTVATGVVNGVVRLSDSTNENSTVISGVAATPRAVQLTWSLANSKFTDIPAQALQRGTVFLTDATDCNVSQASSPIAASAKAVRDAMVMAVAASNWASQRPNNIDAGSLTQAGAVQLSDDQTNTSVTLAATINAVSKVNVLAVGSLQRSGGTMTGTLNVVDLNGTGQLRTAGTVIGGFGGSFIQLMSGGILCAANTGNMRFGFAADNAGTGLVDRMILTNAGNLFLNGQLQTSNLVTMRNGVSIFGTTTTNGSLLANSGITVSGNSTFANSVSIGTSAIPSFPLHVQASTNGTTRNVAFLRWKNTNSLEVATGDLSGPYSICTTSSILCSEVQVFSDIRIKKNIKPLVKSLDIIKNIKCYSYEYLDPVEKGDGTQLGFVAQQLNTVLPQAVDKTIGWIPLNIFGKIKQTADHSVLHINWFGSADPEFYEKKDIRVKLQDVQGNVWETRCTGRQLVDNDFILDTVVNAVDNSVLIQAYEVDDLYNVKRDFVYTVAVDAVKELNEIVIEKNKEIERLGTKVEWLEKQLDFVMDKLREKKIL